MSRLSDLLRQVSERDAELTAEIAAEVKDLELRRAFGLNFERRTPESVELPGRPVRKSDKVRFLPERCAAANAVDTGLWQVIGFRNVEEGARRAAGPPMRRWRGTRDSVAARR